MKYLVEEIHRERMRNLERNERDQKQCIHRLLKLMKAPEIISSNEVRLPLKLLGDMKFKKGDKNLVSELEGEITEYS